MSFRAQWSPQMFSPVYSTPDFSIDGSKFAGTNARGLVLHNIHGVFMDLPVKK